MSSAKTRKQIEHLKQFTDQELFDKLSGRLQSKADAQEAIAKKKEKFSGLITTKTAMMILLLEKEGKSK